MGSKRRRWMLTVGLSLALLCPVGARAQRSWLLSAGVGGATGSFGGGGRGEEWAWGPALVARAGRTVGSRAGVSLLVDYQAFRVKPRGNEAPYRALFVIPSFTLVRRQARFRVGVGMVRLLRQRPARDEWGVAVGALVTRDLPGPWALEGGWRLGGPDSRRRASLYTVSLVRFWRW